MSSDNIADQIRSDMTLAMKAGEGLRVSVLRMLLSELNYKQIDLGRELTGDDVIVVVGREIKKRREAIDSYRQGGRKDQADQEEQELLMLQKYMPSQLSEQEIAKEIDKILPNIESREFGQVMKVISPLFRGRADGGLVAKIVRNKLGI